MKKTKLTEKDYNEFYKLILYGEIKDPLYVSIPVAYKDFCRTIRGFASNPNHDTIFQTCKNVLYKGITELLEYKIIDQNIFDYQHRELCDKLICASEGILTYGQTQKWINMALKYLSMLDHKRVEAIYEFCHVPIDNYILKATNYKFDMAWSKITSYEEYLKYQNWFRNNYKGIPLDEEFCMWMKASKENGN